MFRRHHVCLYMRGAGYGGRVCCARLMSGRLCHIWVTLEGPLVGAISQVYQVPEVNAPTMLGLWEHITTQPPAHGPLCSLRLFRVSGCIATGTRAVVCHVIIWKLTA